MPEPHTPERELTRRALTLAVGARLIEAGDTDTAMQCFGLALACAWPQLATPRGGDHA